MQFIIVEILKGIILRFHTSFVFFREDNCNYKYNLKIKIRNSIASKRRFIIPEKYSVSKIDSIDKYTKLGKLSVRRWSSLIGGDLITAKRL